MFVTWLSAGRIASWTTMTAAITAVASAVTIFQLILRSGRACRA
jgi:hypothetical protein